MLAALLLLCSLVRVFAVERCDGNLPRVKFHRIRHCYRSNLPVIAWRNLKDEGECAKFARERSGLAFNYSPPDAINTTKGYVRNCQVLGCPEVGNSTTLIPDPSFDYYTAYGNLSTTENSTCIKSVGLFDLIQTKSNYTEAIMSCQNLGADMADVLTEGRTNILAGLLQSIKSWYKAAYVGLTDISNEGAFETPSGYFLDCAKFRAWAPGHPRKNRKHDDCVILDVDRVWRAINCKIKLPFICEFFPEAPLVPLNVIKNVNCTGIKEKRRKKKCREKKMLFEIYRNSSRLDKCALLNDFE